MQRDLGNRIKGKVNHYSPGVQSGILICERDNTYLFSRKEWLSENPPTANMDVLFFADRNWAKSILVAPKDS